jgi:hypothetical protein
MTAAYVCDDDVFNAAAVRNARADDHSQSHLAPVGQLSPQNNTMKRSYEEVDAG